jgi:hypothetical protein
MRIQPEAIRAVAIPPVFVHNGRHDRQGGKMRIFGKWIGLLLGVMCLCSAPAYAQADEDLLDVFAGIFAVIDRSESPEDRGQNLDGSLKWEYIEGEEIDFRRMSFNGFRYYVVQEKENPIISLSGNLEMDEAGEFLSGGVAVQGIPQVSSLDFVEYGGETGSVKVNGRLRDNDGIEEIFDEADGLLDDRNIITAETEAVCLFYVMFSSMMETLSERLKGDVHPDNDTDVPSITASNPQGTLKVIMKEDGLEVFFSSYKPDDIPLGRILPVLDGHLIMEYRMAGEETRLDGGVQIKNMPFVSSMDFESCVMTSDFGNEGSGVMILNGAGYEFRDFLNSLGAVSLPADF